MAMTAEMTAALEKAFEGAFETFKQHLANRFDAEVTNEDMLREIFLGEIESLVDTALDGDADSGCCIDELYGDDIFACVKIEGGEDEYEDEDEIAAEE